MPYIHFYCIPLCLNGLKQCIFLSLSLNFTSIFNLQWMKSLKLMLTCSYWWCLTKLNTKLWSASPEMLQCDSRNWWPHNPFKQTCLLPQCCPLWWMKAQRLSFQTNRIHHLDNMWYPHLLLTALALMLQLLSSNVVQTTKCNQTTSNTHPEFRSSAQSCWTLLSKQNCWECKNETVMLLMFVLGRMKMSWEDQWVLSDLLPSSGSS